MDLPEVNRHLVVRLLGVLLARRAEEMRVLIPAAAMTAAAGGDGDGFPGRAGT